MRRGAAALLLLAAAAAAAAAGGATRDLDFEFADTPETEGRTGRYVYEPRERACGAERCAGGARCVLRRGRAVCAGGAPPPPPPRRRPHRLDKSGAGVGARCVGCGAAGGGGADSFLCGSDNRTYSSLCRLDLHNCVRRARVTPACRGACPCPAARAPAAHNEVLPRGATLPAAACPPPALHALAARLLDWAAVLQRDAPPPSAADFPPGCLPEVRWMFSHLDVDGDGFLSHTDLYALRHDDRERCLRPFLATCGGGGGGGGGGDEGGAGVTRAGWCGCLRAARPCARLAALHPPRPGAYVPSCDARGYFRPRQCQLARCWCVDARGAELPARACAPRPPAAAAAAAAAAEGAGENAGAGAGAPADDEDAGDAGDAGGSGDGEPAY